MRPVASAGPRLRSSSPFSALASRPSLLCPDKGMVAAIADATAIDNSFFMQSNSEVLSGKLYARAGIFRLKAEATRLFVGSALCGVRSLWGPLFVGSALCGVRSLWGALFVRSALCGSALCGSALCGFRLQAEGSEDRRARIQRQIDDACWQDTEIEDCDDGKSKTGHRGGRDARPRNLSPFGHVHHDDDPQVEENGNDAGQDADNRQPVVPFLHCGAEDVPLADEARGRRDSTQRQQENRHQAGQGWTRSPQSGEIAKLVVLL